MAQGYSELKNERVSAANGVEYAYRETGEGRSAMVVLQHFRGNLDNWDPALVDALASTRRVITFDNAGVGGPVGRLRTPSPQMARDAVDFLDAMEIDQADILGFSMAASSPRRSRSSGLPLVRRLVLASSAPQGAPGMHGWAAGCHRRRRGARERVRLVSLDVF